MRYLENNKFVVRCTRLACLIAIVEENDCEIAKSILKKARRAYKKDENFTGIIRLTQTEKEWLKYKLKNPYMSAMSYQTIKFYCKGEH